MKALTAENLKEYINETIAKMFKKRTNLDCQEDCRHRVIIVSSCNIKGTNLFTNLDKKFAKIIYERENFEKEFVDIRNFAEIWDAMYSEDKNSGKAVDFDDWLNHEHKERI